MGTVPRISDDAASAEVLAVFDDIRAARRTDYVNNFWRALANDPALLAVIGMAVQTNGLVTAMQVEVDDAFLV
ncbi:MAG: hypothetical protein AAFQ59_11140 [Pseudomonadota bacterium]